MPISDLVNGYTFDDATNPSGPAFNDPVFGFGDSANPFIGATGDGDAMPWNGTTYYLNLFQPLQNYWEHLLADPVADGDIPGTGIQLPTLESFGQSLQSIAASMIVAFNPYVAGSPACPAMCDDIPEYLTTRALVDMLDPKDSNAMIQAWLAGFDGTGAFPDNNATPDQVHAAIALLQTGIFNLTPERLDGVITQLENINPALPALAVNAGFITDPGYLDYVANPGAEFDPVYGGWNPALVWPDMLQLFGVDTGSSGVDELVDPAAAAGGLDAAWSTDWNALLGGFDPAEMSENLSDLLGSFDPPAFAVDWAALLGDFDPAALSTEWANLMEDIAAAFVPDLAASALSMV